MHEDILWFLGLLLIFGILWWVGIGPGRPESTAGPFLKPPPPLDTGEIYGPDIGSAIRQRAEGRSETSAAPAPAEIPRPPQRQSRAPSSPPSSPASAPVVSGDASSATTSPWKGKIRISSSNARYEIQPNQEYITLEVSLGRQGDEPVNITGWQLVNNPLRRARADTAVIPLAAKLFSAAGAQTTLTPILLEPGQRAIVVTGGPPSANRWPARVSFRTNKCIGYLADEFSAFRLTPSFSGGCPVPSKEPGADRLDDDCYKFVRGLSACRTPKFERRADGLNYVDGRIDRLSSACRQYVQSRFNYESCLVWHQLDQDFYRDEWRIYLNRSWELWADNRETISLYDAQGRLVNQLYYE